MKLKLDADLRPRYIYQYSVTGTGRFPFDMLRHAEAWPCRNEDANAMEKLDHRTINLFSYREPSERWQSFGWKHILT